MSIFVAGATDAIGDRLMQLLALTGHLVINAESVIADDLAADAVFVAVTAVRRHSFDHPTGMKWPDMT